MIIAKFDIKAQFEEELLKKKSSKVTSTYQFNQKIITTSKSNPYKKMTKLKLEGECYFCKQTFTKSGIVRHFNNHLSPWTGVPQSSSSSTGVENHSENNK